MQHHMIKRRRVLDAVSVFIVLAYIEVAYLQLMEPNEWLYPALESALFFLLPFTSLSVLVRIADYVNAQTSKHPITVEIAPNRLTGQIGAGEKITLQGTFSSGPILVADPDGFRNAAQTLLIQLKRDTTISLAPYVVVLGGTSLTKVERQAARTALLQAGAATVEMADPDVDLEQFVRAHPQPNPFQL